MREGRRARTIGMAAALRRAVVRRAEDLRDSDERYRRLSQELEARVLDRTEELRRLNLTLTDSEERYRFLFTHMLEGYAHCKIVVEAGVPVDFVYLDINEAFAELTGLRDVVAKRVSEVIPGIRETNPELIATCGRVALTGSPERFETFVEPLGMWFAISVYCPAREHFVAVFDVITERKNAERQLRRSRGVMETILNSVPQSVFWKDRNSVYLGCNEVFAREAGLGGPDEIVGKNDFELPWRDQAEAYRADDREVLRSGRPKRHIVEPVPLADGRTVWVDTTKVPLTDETGSVYAVLGVFDDITERKWAQEELQRSEAKFRTLMDDSPVAIGISRDGVTVYANKKYVKMFGFRGVDEIRGTPIGEHWAPRSRAEVEERVRRRELGLPVPAEYEAEGQRADGSRFPVLVSASLVHLADGPASVAFLTDVSERLKLEEHVRQAQKIEAVGNLAGGVAHDFNNLLQALLAHVQILRVHNDDPERTLDTARELEQQILRGASLTRQLLLFSRRETAKRERVELGDEVREAAKLLRRLVRANIGLELRLAPETLPVKADRGQLVQVLMNLAVNASDAMPDGGTLHISTGASGGDSVWLAVRDTGHGIPEVIREHIFEPFFTTKPAGKGTGLGLAVVHGIAAGHGGRVEVDSAVGEGTCVRIVLPRAGAEPAPPSSAAPGSPASLATGRGERILIVEDEDAARDALREILRSLGYEATAVASGEEAEGLPAEPFFDALLTDLMLPGVAGPALAARLQARWPALRVILMSGYTEDEAVRRGVRDGDVRFLQKPFDMDTLAREVRAALDEPPARQE